MFPLLQKTAAIQAFSSVPIIKETPSPENSNLDKHHPDPEIQEKAANILLED